MILTEEDKSTQTLLLDRAYKSFRIGVALRNPGRAENDFYTGGFENLPKASAVFGVPVNNQVRFAKREALYCVHELTGSLFHPFGVGWPQVQAADSALSIQPGSSIVQLCTIFPPLASCPRQFLPQDRHRRLFHGAVLKRTVDSRSRCAILSSKGSGSGFDWE